MTWGGFLGSPRPSYLLCLCLSPPAPSPFPSFTHFPSGPGRVEGRLKGDTRRYGGKAGELHFPACNAEEGNA